MKIKLFIIFALLSEAEISAQLKVTSVSPSAFYTYANYSDKSTSNAVSLFTTATLNYKDYLSAGFDKQQINSSNWKYNQQMLTIGGTKNLYPFYLGLFYSNIQGDYNSIPAGFNYTDKINLFDINLLFNYKLFYFGISGNYISLKGFYNLSIKHYSAAIKKLIGIKFMLAAIFTQTVVSDNRNLSSIKLDINYFLSNSLTISGSTVLGNRAYYFDDELLSIFNQHETQKLNFSSTVKYSMIPNMSLILNYTYSDFSDYQINYFVAGIKYIIN